MSRLGCVVSCLLLLATTGCRDGPVAVEESTPPDQEIPVSPGLVDVVYTLHDDFAGLLAADVLEVETSKQVTLALSRLRQAPSESTLASAIHALDVVRADLGARRSGPLIHQSNSPDRGFADAELDVIEDALLLILDEALNTVLTGFGPSEG